MSAQADRGLRTLVIVKVSLLNHFYVDLYDTYQDVGQGTLKLDNTHLPNVYADDSLQRQTHQHADKDGHFRRKDSQFRSRISRDTSSTFPAEANRYVLYMNYGCPWAHRTSLVRGLKGLDSIIQMVPTDFDLTKDGWLFTGKNGSLEKDPLYGFTALKQLYLKADPTYEGRYTVPCLWDKKQETIVNNESAEIIRMFYSEFDELLPEELRESNRPGGGLYPDSLRAEIDTMNEWVYNTVNNGVYKCGFATSQEAYKTNIYPLFESLDRLEAHLAPGNSANHGGPYLFGKYLTEADIRLYTTMIRFDAAYHTIFLCNLKSVRHDYRNLYKWLRLCYWQGGAPFSTAGDDRTSVFKDTTNFQAYREGYTRARGRIYTKGDDKLELVVPAGPLVDIDPLDSSDDATSASVVAGRIEQMKMGDGKRDVSAAVFAANEPDTSKTTEAEPSETLEPQTAHIDENKKWYKAAKKAEKVAGVPNVHLAL